MKKWTMVTMLAALTLGSGVLAAEDSAGAGAENRGEGRRMEENVRNRERRQANDPAVQALREKQRELMKLAKQYREAEGDAKEKLGVELRQKIHDQVVAMIAAARDRVEKGRARLAEQQARLDQISKEIDAREADIDTAVDREFKVLSGEVRGQGRGQGIGQGFMMGEGRGQGNGPGRGQGNGPGRGQGKGQAQAPAETSDAEAAE